MSLRDRTVLVTGGTGFIGGRLVEKLVLDEGCRVRVLVRNFAHAARISPYPVELLAGDLRDRDSIERAIRGCDVVFHCAYDFVPSVRGQRHTGVEGTRNVAELVLAEGVERLVHLSSMAVYEPVAPGDLTEDSPWPASEDPYVVVKREAERLLIDLHRTRGLPFVTLQPTIVYGPFSGIWTLGPVRHLRNPKSLLPILDGGEGPCNAVYVDDLVAAMILAAERPDVVGERFLVSADAPVTWKAYYQALEAAVGVDSTVEVSTDDVRRMKRQRERRGSLSNGIRRRMRDPRTWSRLGGLPVLRTVRKVLPKAVLSKMTPRPDAGDEAPPTAEGARRIALPSEAAIQAQTSPGRVRIDRAREMLGYEPRFDLERGMEVTKRYLEWANLVGEA